MAKLRCKDYGFECEFEAETKDASEMFEKFGGHTLDEHGIEYSKEVLMQIVLRKREAELEPSMQVA